MAYQNNWPDDLNIDEPFGVSPLPLTKMMTRFKSEKLRQWTREDIVDWVHYACQQNQIEYSLVNVSGFASLTGSDLADMTENDFLRIERIYGRELHRALNPYRKFKTTGGKLISDSTMHYPNPESLNFYDKDQDTNYSTNLTTSLTIDCNDHGSYSRNYPLSPSQLMNNLTLDSPNVLSPYDSSPFSSYNPSDYLSNNSTQAHANDDIYFNNSPLSFNSELTFDESDDLTELTPVDLEILHCPSYNDPNPSQTPDWFLDTAPNLDPNWDLESGPNPTPNWDLLGADLIPQPGTSSSPSRSPINASVTDTVDGYRGTLPADDRRRRLHSGGVSSASSASSCGSRTPSPSKMKSPRSASRTPKPAATGAPRPRNSGSSSSGVRKERGKKVWEFLLDLLNDPESNPSMIRWENQSEGIFRLVEHESIARRWGMRRDRGDLSYDYFARTMRYQYTTHMLESVPERKLVYKFGAEVMARLRQQEGTSSVPSS